MSVDKKAPSVLFDSNVIIDALSHRPGSSSSSQSLYRKAASGEIHGLILSKQITDIHYVLRRYVKDEETNMRMIQTLLTIFDVLPFELDDILEGMQIGFSDFEDGVLAAAARKAGAEYIVTSNTADFGKSPVPAVSPDELMNEWKPA